MFRNRTKQGSELAIDPKSATFSLKKDNILPAERLQKHQHKASFVGATQLGVALFRTAPQKTILCLRNKSVAPSWSGTDLFDVTQRAVLPFLCTAEAPLEDKVLMDWVLTAKRSSDFSVLRIANIPLPNLRSYKQPR